MMLKKRRTYTGTERARILKAVERQGLTYAQAAKRFSVSEVTIGKWRRDAKGAMATRHPTPVHTGRVSSDGSLASLIRTEVQAARPRAAPPIIREEIAQI